MTKKNRKTTDRLSDRKLFDLAAQFEAQKDRAKKAEHDPETGWRAIQSKLVSEFRRRKVKTLTDTSGTKVTFVAPEKVVYNEDGLWDVLSPTARKHVFDRTINLSKLPADAQKALLTHLTPAQRKRVISHKLNVDKLATAVADKKIPVEVVAENSEIQESSPYVIVSHEEAS
jgi:hypothetical protein